MNKEKKCVYKKCQKISEQNGFFCNEHLELFLKEEGDKAIVELLTSIDKYERSNNP